MDSSNRQYDNTRSQIQTNMMVGEQGIQTFGVMIIIVLEVLLFFLFDEFVPASAHPLSFLDKWLVQIYFNVS